MAVLGLHVSSSGIPKLSHLGFQSYLWACAPGWGPSAFLLLLFFIPFIFRALHFISLCLGQHTIVTRIKCSLLSA